MNVHSLSNCCPWLDLSLSIHGEVVPDVELSRTILKKPESAALRRKIESRAALWDTGTKRRIESPDVEVRHRRRWNSERRKRDKFTEFRRGRWKPLFAQNPNPRWKTRAAVSLQRLCGDRVQMGNGGTIRGNARSRWPPSERFGEVAFRQCFQVSGTAHSPQIIH